MSKPKAHFFRDANDTQTVIYTLELPTGDHLAYRNPDENIEGWGQTMMEAIVDLRERLEDEQDDGE